VDVHIRLRTGGRERPHAIQSGGRLSIGKSGALDQPSKK